MSTIDLIYEMRCCKVFKTSSAFNVDDETRSSLENLIISICNKYIQDSEDENLMMNYNFRHYDIGANQFETKLYIDLQSDESSQSKHVKEISDKLENLFNERTLHLDNITVVEPVYIMRIS